MEYRYYGKLNDFLDQLKNMIHNLNFNIDDNKIVIKKGNNELIINYTKTEFPIRSFSKPLFDDNHLLLTIYSNEVDDFKSELATIKNICLMFSDNEINAVLSQMPILKWYSTDKSNNLKNIAIIWRDHFLEENIGLLHTFTAMGVLPGDMLVLDKGDQTKHQEEITQTFKKLGYHVDVLDNSVIDELDNIASYQLINDFIESRKDKKIIIIDDGAILTKILNERFYANIIAIIELTEMGLRRIGQLDQNLLYPVLNIAKTSLKRKVTYPEIANSIFVKLIELLGGEKLVGRSVLLCGYGDMGEILAERLRSYGARVSITDPDIFRLIVAGERGYCTYINPVRAIQQEQPFLLLGASGYNSIDDNMIREMPDNSYVTAGATADLSIFKKYEERNEKFKKISQYGTQYYIYNKNITVLGNGRSINLFDSEAIPNKSNDIFKAAIIVTADNIVNNDIKLEKAIELYLIEQFIKNSNILEKYYDLYINRE